MCVGNSFEENKRELNKSIAKVMVYWIVHSRHDLRQELIDRDPTKTWAGLALQTAFDSKEEWEGFFQKAANLFDDEIDIGGSATAKIVRLGAERINQRVDGKDGERGDWCPIIVPDCPSNLIINLMYRAAEEFVNKQ
jgi:hypothetical protein